MRTLVIGALAATLAGCSSQPLSQRSCTGLNPLACLTAVDIPIESASRHHSAEANTSTIARHEETQQRPPADRAPHRPPRPKVAKAAPTAPLPTPSPPKATEQQAASVSVSAAEGMPDATSEASLEPLVAILVTTPDVRSVKELSGKTIAIDDRYSAPSIGRVRIAMAAAGAADVQLSKGQTTAINRLADKEVPAAIIGLVSTSAADSFSELARFKTFRVPLSTHVAKK